MGMYCIKIWISGFILKIGFSGHSQSAFLCDHNLLERRGRAHHSLMPQSFTFLALVTLTRGEGWWGRSPVSLCNISPGKYNTRTAIHKRGDNPTEILGFTEN